MAKGNSRVVFILNDGMHPEVAQIELAAGRMPNLAYLVSNGRARWDTVSVFPTSTPTAVSSITTGAWPSAHRIPGMFWYDRGKGPVYYGDNLTIIGQHFGTFFENMIGNLNHRHLSDRVSTLFEQIESRGLAAAALNCMCFRGFTEHRTTLPMFLRMVPGVRFSIDTVRGPMYMRWGDFARSGPSESRMFGEHGPFRQFGINDGCTMEAFLALAESGPLPDFVMLYFPDNDVWSHQHGPDASGPALRRFDANLGRIFDVLGGAGRALEETTFVLIADHAQVAVGYAPESVIDLDTALASFAQLRFGQPWGDETLFACPNGRFAQVYLHARQGRRLAEVVETLGRDERIAHLTWREGDTFHVASPARGRLSFRRGLRHRDRLGFSWRWWGDPSVLDVHGGRVHVEFEAFPDAFARVAGALENTSAGELLLTAREGCEFAGNGEEAHLGGGSHGGLLSAESRVPFVVAGPHAFSIDNVRTILDAAPWITTALGLARKRLRRAA